MQAKTQDALKMRRYKNMEDKKDLLIWFSESSAKLDVITLVGIAVILIFYNTATHIEVQEMLSGEFSSVNSCFLNFYIFHSIIAVFVFFNTVSTFFQIKDLNKNSIKELCNYLNEPTFEKNLITGDLTLRKKRKFSFFFVLFILALLIPFIFFDWYKYLEECSTQNTSLPFGSIGIVCYSALCIRMPNYLIGILNFKFGD